MTKTPLRLLTSTLLAAPTTFTSAFVDAAWCYQCLKAVSDWVSVDAPNKLSELIIDFYKQGNNHEPE